MPSVDIVNIVGMITYQQELALEALANAFSEQDEITSVTYDPTENHWLQTRFAPDDTYVAFYRSGRCSTVGCQSIEHFHETADQVIDVMQDLLEFEYEPEVEVSNIVATADLGTPIPLEVLTLELGLDAVEYEPEQFPALIYRTEDHVILVFSSGKLLCTGITDLDDVAAAIERFTTRIQSVL